MTLTGIVLKGIGGFYYVETAGEVYECRARGIFRKDKISPMTGDYVHITVNPDTENVIDEILPRKNSFQRPPIANLDQLIIVTSICEPNPNTLIIDKLTAIAHFKDIEAIIAVTKADKEDTDDLIKIYKNSGFQAYSVSGRSGEGIRDIKNVLQGHVSAFTGNSGVGKTTLINCIDKELVLKTGEISRKLGRGKHTTRYTELYKVIDGYVADTPGFTSLDFGNDEAILRDDLQFCFKEFTPLLGRCKFSTCSHLTDAGCSIRDAVDNGTIEQSRYDSYKAIYNEVKTRERWN